jgi:hypothetical protein
MSSHSDHHAAHPLDLPVEAARLRLDVLAVQISGALRRSGIDHVLIKGPSTSLWLYDPPRAYRDIDILVPHSMADDAAARLESAGVARALSGAVGEEASHSLLLHSTEGFEVDLHVSLPNLPGRGDLLWTSLAPHAVELDLGVGSVPALDEVGRCLVVALHAVGAGAERQPLEDLRRARSMASPDSWAAVQLLANRLDAVDLVMGALSRIESPRAPLSRRARLLVSGAPAPALGIQRLLDAPRRDLPRLVWREIFPTRGFLVGASRSAHVSRVALMRARITRWRWIVSQLPQAVRAWHSPK